MYDGQGAYSPMLYQSQTNVKDLAAIYFSFDIKQYPGIESDWFE